MLQELRINDLALISSLELDFSAAPAGLIVFTGETGAGKSIILQAVHLLTGGRASSSLVRSSKEQASVEAAFDISRQPELVDLLCEYGLENGSDCILRRVVTSKGRSRFFINDRLTSARTAADLTENLVNIAGQHDQQMLLRSGCHIDFLDGYGGLLEQRQQYSQLYERRRKLLRRLRQLREQEQHKEQQRDFLNFQLREIRQAELLPGEEEGLIQERDRLRFSSTLVELAGTSCQLLREQVHEPLTLIRKNMEEALELDAEIKELADRVVSACFEIEDLEGCLDAYLESIPSDQGRMDAIAGRLAKLRQLQRKYGPTVENVLDFAEKIEKELEQLDHLEQEISALEQELRTVETELRRQATVLSQARIQVGEKLSQALQTELSSLSFRQARFGVSIIPAESFDGSGLLMDGMDRVEFLFSANLGEPLKPLTEVVSGGELSRLMLAMKCLFARQDRVETVILDEIDTGISGEAASAVARKINELAGHHQVFCITHLPQIAAYADVHFLVEKTAQEDRTQTSIRCLAQDDRVPELARMLGGDNPTEQTFALAQELLERHQRRM